jgi:predicted nucleotidyltransferase
VVITETVTDVVRHFIGALQSANAGREIAVVLVGSVARNTATSHSDLDLLVVSTERLTRTESAEGLHVQMFTKTQFIERLSTGDDFAAWCVRYGIPVLDAPVWGNILASPEAKTWPSWRAKVVHVVRRLLIASELTRTGDFDAAREELVYAISHVGRALLLKHGEFPLSRPEMVGQLKELGYPDLAKLLDLTAAHEAAERQVSQAMQYVKKLLVYLDKDQYETLLEARRAVAAKKKRPA